MADVVISKPTLRRLSHIKSRQPRTEIRASQCPIDRHQNRHIRSVRDWSLITGRGSYKMGKICCAPPPSRQGKTFCAPIFKEWKRFAPTLLRYG